MSLPVQPVPGPGGALGTWRQELQGAGPCLRCRAGAALLFLGVNSEIGLMGRPYSSGPQPGSWAGCLQKSSGKRSPPRGKKRSQHASSLTLILTGCKHTPARWVEKSHSVSAVRPRLPGRKHREWGRSVPT